MNKEIIYTEFLLIKDYTFDGGDEEVVDSEDNWIDILKRYEERKKQYANRDIKPKLKIVKRRIVEEEVILLLEKGPL